MTLIEVLITVAIAGIILAWGLPNLANYVRTSRVVSASNELVAALTAARTFAIARSVSTVICASSNGTSCAGVATAWSNGWLVFEDCDGDNSLDTSAVTCADGSRPETLIKANQYLSAGTTITNGNDSFSFSTAGTPSATQTFTLCRPPRGRTINLGAGGRAEVTEANDPC